MSLRFTNIEQARKALGKNVKINYEPPAKESKRLVLANSKRKGKSKEVPQVKLLNALRARFPQHRIVSEHNPEIEGRKFRIDAAFPDLKIACECDGWQYHGAYLSGFASNLERQNLLVIHGWRPIRFSAGEIHKNIEECLRVVALAIENVAPAQSLEQLA